MSQSAVRRPAWVGTGGVGSWTGAVLGWTGAVGCLTGAVLGRIGAVGYWPEG